MSWPETKGDKAFAGFLILFVVLAIQMGFESSARSRCEDVLEELQESIYRNFGEGLGKKLYNSFASARGSCHRRHNRPSAGDGGAD